MRNLLIIFLLSVFHLLSGQQAAVKLSNGNILYQLSEQRIFDSAGQQLLYFSKGNIFFKGDADSRDNIFLLCSSMDPFTPKMATISEGVNGSAVYSFSEGHVYYGKNPVADEQNMLLYIKHYPPWQSIYNALNDSLLAYFPDSLPASHALLVSYSLIKKYRLGDAWLQRIKDAGTQNQTNGQSAEPGGELASMRPLWGSSVSEWSWDGQILRPKWNVDPMKQWQFDGRTIKPVYGNNINEQYEWDGEEFKPVWRRSRNEEWSWDGQILKPSWGTDWADQYNIIDGVIKPWSNVHTEKEWKMEGNMPIPCIIVVISGIAKP